MTPSSVQTPYTQFFDDPAEARHDVLGGKCASLVTMTVAGMPVPPGFAVTTAAFDAFIDAAGIAGTIRSLLAGLDVTDPTQVDSVSGTIRGEICTRPLPQAVCDEITGAFGQLQSRFAAPVPVAVRSSATAEDLPDASFAGQQDTYLWLSGIDDVLHHVRRCWGSLYTSRAITYRLRNGIPDEGLSMAVAVQKMVNARAAGVAITMNPATGDRSKITVDASYGVGEMVVSGTVTPDNIVLDKVMLAVVSQTIGAKHAELVPDAGAQRLVEREVDPARRARRCIDDAELAAVAALAKRCEKHYRCPQDVEWAVDADLPDGENVLLLQSRPETVHSNAVAPAPVPAAAAGPAFSLGSITSSLLGRGTPV
jgi:pyruvate,water dikinase